jgi:ketosteroid isomerase-like protein
MEEEILKVEEAFADAIARNDLEAIGRFVSDDWIIINADGGITDKERFFEVIKSGALTHEMMESDEIRIRLYGDSAVLSALTRTKGKFMGQEFTTEERSTDFFVRLGGEWRCVLTQLTRFSKR